MRYLIPAAGLLVLVLGGSAGAVDGRVRSACANDYLTYCSQHDPDGAGVRACMAANGSRLSPGCINALVAAGEVEQPTIARQSKQKQAKPTED